MLHPEIQAIAFDAVGTLIHPTPSAPGVYAEVGRRFGSRLSAEEVMHRFRAAFAREEELDRLAGWRTSEDREFERRQRIVATVLDDVSDPDVCFQELYEHFSRPESWRTEPDTQAVLEALAERGYVLALASNYDCRLTPVLAGLPDLHSIRHVVISSAVGWRKPAAEFFAQLARQIGRSAEHVLFVGDDMANDYTAAREAGMRAVLFDPRGRAGGGVAHAKSLLELLG